jgi:predicted PurR-regulated permease PerM
MLGRQIPLWLIAIVAVGAALYWLRDVLAPFVLAFILWLAIDSLATFLRRMSGARTPRWLNLGVAICFVLGAGALIIYALARNTGVVTADAVRIGPRFEALAREAQAFLRIDGDPVTLRSVLTAVGPVAIIGWLARALQTLINQTTLILIYLLFFFPAATAFDSKMLKMAPNPEARANIVAVLARIRTSVERYLAVQTGMSLLITTLSYITLTAIGLPNAIFWCSLMFFLNYIPTLGSIIAVTLPTLFALVEFPDWRMAGVVALGLHVWQFGIGTFLQPRITGASINLSSLVVVLALAIWGSLWGIIGVFLAAPLTVLIVIVLDQFEKTKWIAVLLSAEHRRAPSRADSAAPIS